MRALTFCFTVLLSLMTFFSTAYADVIDPGGGPRPPRPMPDRLILREYDVRTPDFKLVQSPDNAEEYLLKVTLPGPCDWQYTVFSKAPKEQFTSEKFGVMEASQTEDVRNIVLKTPEDGADMTFGIQVIYTMYVFAETRYGPKLYSKEGNQKSVIHGYKMKKSDGGFILEAK